MISIAHRIELKPNNKQKTYFRKAFGCARLAYNWGLEEWDKQYKEGVRGIKGRNLRKEFNAIKREQFPFVTEVSKWATDGAFEDLQDAYDRFFKHLAGRPTFHRKRDGGGSFYMGGCDTVLSETNRNLKHLKGVEHNKDGKHQYLGIPHLGFVKMAEHLRFNGHLNSVRISQNGDRFFASFSLKITEEEYVRTHPLALIDKQELKVGIDMGVHNAIILSDGIKIDDPKPLKQNLRKQKRLSRQLSKRQHARTKQERLEGVKKSNNYKKLSRRLGNLDRHIANIRRDFTQKLTTVITTHYAEIAIEDLNVKGMQKSHRLARSVSDVAMGEMRRQIEYKAAFNGVSVTKADRFYPSSKTCSCCGAIKPDLTLKERTYICPACGAFIDRDYNASLNLLSLITKTIGMDGPESTPADLAALLSRFTVNGIATVKVETGKQQKSYV
jgi:putative transposase